MWLFGKSKYALATVTTTGFVSGSMVMIFSFLRHNPQFKGDIIIFHDAELQDADLELFQFFPSVKTILIDPRLRERTVELATHFPDFLRRLGQFYSLEVFQITGYDKVLFMDSDTLFRGGVQQLFESSAELQVCAKAGKYKNAEGYDPSKPFSIEQFNAGVMFLDKSLLNKEMYESLLSRVSLSFFSSFLETVDGEMMIPERFGTDQLIINSILHEKAQFLPMKYNYRFGIADEIRKKEGTTIENAVIIHFTGKRKPWITDLALRRLRKNANEAKGFIYWTETYLTLQQEMSKMDRFKH